MRSTFLRAIKPNPPSRPPILTCRRFSFQPFEEGILDKKMGQILEPDMEPPVIYPPNPEAVTEIVEQPQSTQTFNEEAIQRDVQAKEWDLE